MHGWSRRCRHLLLRDENGASAERASFMLSPPMATINFNAPGSLACLRGPATSVEHQVRREQAEIERWRQELATKQGLVGSGNGCPNREPLATRRAFGSAEHEGRRVHWPGTLCRTVRRCDSHSHSSAVVSLSFSMDRTKWLAAMRKMRWPLWDVNARKGPHAEPLMQQGGELKTARCILAHDAAG